MIIPVEPDLVRSIGQVPAAGASLWLGTMLAAFAAMQFFAAPLLGALSDRLGRRPVLLVSLAALGVSAVVSPYVPNLWCLVAVRAFAGATSGNAAAAQAYIADVSAPAERARRFGMVGALYGLGFVLGPAFGGALGLLGVAWPFLAYGALAGVNVLYGLVALPESLPPARRRRMDWARANPIGTLGAVFSRAPVALAVAWSCAWFALGAQQSGFIIANELRYHWSTITNGLVLALAGLASALTQGVLVGPVVRRLGRLGTALLGLGCSALGYVIYAFAATPLILLPGIAVLAFGALANPALQSLVSGAVDERRQGEVQGALACLQGLMAVVSPALTGWIFSRTAASFVGASFLLAALVCAAGGVALALLMRAEWGKTQALQRHGGR